MKIALTKIGNSKGIIIPSRILKLLGLEKEVSLTVENNNLIISSASAPRQGWEEQFLAAGAGEEKNLMGDIENEFDQEEWEW